MYMILGARALENYELELGTAVLDKPYPGLILGLSGGISLDKPYPCLSGGLILDKPYPVLIPRCYPG